MVTAGCLWPLGYNGALILTRSTSRNGDSSNWNVHFTNEIAKEFLLKMKA
jgi:hypothetical protein